MIRTKHNKYSLGLILTIIYYILVCSSSNSQENKILFKVNNEIITSVDLINEIEYLSLLNNNLKSLDKEKIFEIAKSSLLREKIKTIELSKTVRISEIDQKYTDILLDQFMKKLNLNSKDEFKKLIEMKDIKFETVEHKLKIELLWNQLILNKFSKDVKIDKKKVKEDVLKNNLQKEFLLSEIVFDLNNEKLNEKFNIIKKEIFNNGFENAALLYSISATANSGGKLGWIKLNSLNKKIKNEILNTDVKNFTNPIVIPGGFVILKIEDQKETEKIVDVEREVEMLVNEIANKQLNQFSNIYFNKIKKEFQINEF